MQRSEYATQAYINDGLNQQQGLDSLEGSAALLQANKPEVDGTDIQKAQILANANAKQPVVQSLSPGNLMKPISRHKSPILPTKTAGKKPNKLSSNNNVRRTQ
jgi:hypothetical protein